MGEYAALNGFGGSGLNAGGFVLGLDGLALTFDCVGGVAPEENLELIDEIQELRLPIGFGELLWTVGDPDAFDSPFSSKSVFSSGLGPSDLLVSLDSGAGAAFDALDASEAVFCETGFCAALLSTPGPDSLLIVDEADLQRDR